MESNEPRNLSNRKDRAAGTDLFLKLGQCASVEGVLEDLTRIATDKGIYLCGIRIKSDRLEREFYLPNNGAVAGKISEFTVAVKGGHTQLVVLFCESVDSSAISELQHAALLAAHRIEFLTRGGLRADRKEIGNEDPSPTYDLIGESELILEVRKNITIAATTNLSVLITGEPGTGKELVACGIHKAGNRAEKPFIDVNIASLSPNLIESELFGHEKGSFTGANGRKIGIFESANGGTLFIDEIGDLPLQYQATLLRVLQERKLLRVGGAQVIKVDLQLIAATNHNLLREIEEGRFRRDLYDRLCGYPIRTPALREHPTDIPFLIRHYFPRVEFQKEALDMLCRYRWPGNVRELISTIERLAAKAGFGRIITTGQVRQEIEIESTFAKGNTACLPAMREGETLREFLDRIMLLIYEESRERLGNHSAVARQLGIKRTTLYDWVASTRRHIKE